MTGVEAWLESWAQDPVQSTTHGVARMDLDGRAPVLCEQNGRVLVKCDPRGADGGEERGGELAWVNGVLDDS